MASIGLGVTIGSHSLRAVKLRKKGQGYIVTGVFADRLDDDTRGLAGRALAASGFKGTPATVGFTGRDVIIRYTQVPPVPDWRLDNLMKFEVDEVSAQSGGDVSADYKKLDLPDPEGTRDDDTILVALARNTYVDQQVRSLDSGGIKFAGGCPNSVALFNAFAVNATYTEDETALLVNIGAENIDIAVQQGGELLFARNATPGGQAFTEAIQQAFNTTPGKAETMKRTKGDVTPKGEARYPDPTAEKVANAIMGVAGQVSSMIQSTLMIARAQTRTPDLRIDRVWLAGGGASLKGLDRYLGQAMGVPVEHLDPFAICDLSQLGEAEQALVQEAPHEFAVAVGLAQNQLDDLAFGLDLMPSAMRRTRDLMTKGVWAMAAAAVAVGALGLLYLSRTGAAEAYQTELRKTRQEAKKADQRDKKLRDALASSQDVAIKHELLAQRAAPGALLSQVLHILEGAFTEGGVDVRNVYIESVELQVSDKNHAITQWVPNGKVASGYTRTTRSRRTNMAREAEVRVIARVGGGTNKGAKLYQDFYQACLGNKLGLTVQSPKGFRAGNDRKDGHFELRFLQGTAVQLKTDGSRGAEVLLRNLRVDDPEDPTAVIGDRIDGVPVRIATDDIRNWKALQKELGGESR